MLMQWFQEDWGADAFEDIMESPEARSMGVVPNSSADSNNHSPQALELTEGIAALVCVTSFLDVLFFKFVILNAVSFFVQLKDSGYSKADFLLLPEVVCPNVGRDLPVMLVVQDIRAELFSDLQSMTDNNHREGSVQHLETAHRRQALGHERIDSPLSSSIAGEAAKILFFRAIYLLYA
jgi:hypothetical protein